MWNNCSITKVPRTEHYLSLLVIFSTKEEISLESIARDLEKGTFKNIVVMCGAGISTNAGVPDFRR